MSDAAGRSRQVALPRRFIGAAPFAMAVIALGCGGSSKPGGTSAASSAASTAATVPATSTAPAGGTAPAGARVVREVSAGVEATMHAGTHTPRVDAAWPVHFSVRRGGRAAAASVRYEYLLQGQVVARRSHFTFHGSFSDVFHWPAAAVGYPLTFRAVIQSGGATVNLDYTVQVHR